jgi:hypothetical protein
MIKSICGGLLLCVKKSYFVYFCCFDMGVYLLQKMARDDYHYWVPTRGGLELFVSLVFRMINKIITDYTGVVQFRHPNELGGAYYVFNLFVTLLMSFAAAYLYYNNPVRDGGVHAVQEHLAWVYVAMLDGTWLVLFWLFLKLMKPKYRKTFINTETGAQQVRNIFLKGESDQEKMEIFRFNQKQWRSVRDDVKEFVLKNWWKFEDEKPDWYTDIFKFSVPYDMIPTEVRDEVKRRGSMVRRKSFFDLITRNDEEYEMKLDSRAKKASEAARRRWAKMKAKIGSESNVWKSSLVSHGKDPLGGSVDQGFFSLVKAAAAAEEEKNVKKIVGSGGDASEAKKRFTNLLAKAGTVT